MTRDIPFENIMNMLIEKIINENYIKNKIIDFNDFILKIKILIDLYNKYLDDKAYKFFKKITSNFCEFMVFLDDKIFKFLNLENDNESIKMELIL